MDLRKTLFILPNLFTVSSIFCGFDAIRIVAAAPPPETNPQPYYLAALLLVFAMFFDTIDGRVARLTKTQSAFGVQIDSLADVISFGVAPSILVYRWSLADLGMAGVIVSFVFCATGAIRLARFNVLAMNPKGAPTKPGKYITGLPIPGAAGVLLAVIIANHSVRGTFWSQKGLIVALVLALSTLMVSTVQFRSFKDLRLNRRSAALMLIAFLSTMGVGLRFGPAFALPWILGCYIAIAIVESIVKFPTKVREVRRARQARRRAPRDVSDPETRAQSR